MLLNRYLGLALPALTIKDGWYFLGTFTWYIPLMNYWVSGFAFFTDLHVFLMGTLLSIPISFISFYTHVVAVVSIANYYPEARQTFRRVVLMLLTAIILTLLYELIWFYISSLVPVFHFQLTWDNVKFPMALGLVINFLSISVYEAFHSFSQWNKTQLEKEQLKKANLQSQYDSLKNQVNPHFLFNSLNSLSSLILEDAAQAGTFVDELSKVYRYLLQSNDKDLTSLADETRFINSYTHLLKTRYGPGIAMMIEIEERYKSYLLPPLTLQMLVENAVKHNIILADKPLCIYIQTTANGWLQVQNNLQKKVTYVSSNRVGLNNIITKYHLLTQQEVVVSETNTHFSVTLPLIPQYNHAGTHS